MIRLGAAEVDSEGKKKEVKKLAPLTNGRALNEEEIIAEEKAESLPRAKYKRIPPLPGTLAYLLRDIEGGNYAIAGIVKEVLSTQTLRNNPNSHAGKINKIILIWNKFDDFSKRRIDVFDWLCEDLEVSKKKFYAIVMEGLFDHFEAVSQRLLMEAKPELINTSRQLAKEERNFRDRELMFKATGATKDVPLVNVDASTNINNTTYQSNFRDILKRTDKDIDENYVDAEIVKDERKALNPVSMENYIDASLFKEENETELVERKVEVK